MNGPLTFLVAIGVGVGVLFLLLPIVFYICGIYGRMYAACFRAGWRMRGEQP